MKDMLSFLCCIGFRKRGETILLYLDMACYRFAEHYGVPS